MSVIDPALPLNSGWFYLVEVSAPFGTLSNPAYPAPMFHGTGAPMIRINEATIRALAQAVPDRVVAASYGSGTAFILYFRSPDGGERVWMNYMGGGCGARAGKNGLDGYWWTLCNCKNEAVEIIETRFPVLVESVSWYAGSAGAGRTRGGLGLERVLLLRSDAMASSLNDRHTVAPWGLGGGKPGLPSRQLIERDGRPQTFSEAFQVASPSKFDNVPLKAGDRIILSTGGGGGYGDPLEREHACVASDVAAGYISREDAARLYGVILLDDGTVDIAATLDVRSARSCNGQYARDV
jgi:N-methylhydantoinase B/oxoprolinase/acetone carboxylase alpha subunit